MQSSKRLDVLVRSSLTPGCGTIGGAMSSPDPVQHPVRLVVGAAVVDDLERPTRLLSARRTEPSALAGGWELPGGKVDPGEEPLVALHREIREELGVQVALGPEVVGPVDGAWRLSDTYVMRLWLAEIADGVPRPLVEHDELRWLPPGQWRSVPWLDADVPIVEAVAGIVARV